MGRLARRIGRFGAGVPWTFRGRHVRARCARHDTPRMARSRIVETIMAWRAFALLPLLVASGSALIWTASTGVADGSLPVALRMSAACVLDSTIYVIGGFNGANDVDTVYYSTDPVANGWSTSGNALPVVLRAHAVAVLSSTIYVMGGAIGTGTSKTVE